MDFTEALHYINTISQRDVLIKELEDLLEALYEHKGGTIISALSATLSYNNEQAILTLMRANEIKDTDPIGLQQLIKNFVEYLQKLPVVELTIAFEPKEKDLKDIYSWFLANVNKKVLLAVGVDESLVAGAIINYAGYRQDLSLRHRLERLPTTSATSDHVKAPSEQKLN